MNKAAEGGLPNAMSDLGLLLITNSSTKHDAFKWVQRAANEGFPSAMNTLATWFAEGNGVPKDSAKAREWFTKATALGFEPAKANLAMLK